MTDGIMGLKCTKTLLTLVYYVDHFNCSYIQCKTKLNNLEKYADLQIN